MSCDVASCAAPRGDPGPGADALLSGDRGGTGRSSDRSSGGDASGRCGGGDRDGLGAPPVRLRFAARTTYPREAVFSICDLLSRAEATLTRLGASSDAAELAAAFEVLEAGLAS